jgi:ornithine cyclodeaminase/alanine dehydrogenase-like protein (mu-crystallin family)
MPLLFLNGAEVEALLPMAECIEMVAGALAALARGEALQPLRSAHWLPDRRGLLGVMPGYVGGMGGSPPVLGSKVISVFFDNHRHGLDSHQGVVLLFEPERGVPLAVLDAAVLRSSRSLFGLRE